MYAVIETGGKQYKVTPGQLLKVERLEAAVGEQVRLAPVLMIHGEDQFAVGAPALEKANVVGEVMEHGRDQKVIVFKKKRRKNYRRTKGHRQPYTKLKILEISVGDTA